MFCPRCSVENNLQQSYCRQCGLALPVVRLALEGQVQEAIRTIRRGQVFLRVGLMILLIFFLILLISFLTGGWVGFVNMSSMMVFVALALMLLLIGVLRIERISRLLNASDQSKRLATNQSGASDNSSRTVSLTESKQPAPVSATESTTLKLKGHEHDHKTELE